MTTSSNDAAPPRSPLGPDRVIDLASGIDADLAGRIDFLLEIDKLKGVLRRSRLVDGSRFENTAEHSWHLAMAAIVLAPNAGPDVDLVRAIEILLVHDLVEIDAGDTYIYDEAARSDKEAKEQAAADRIFNLLPRDQADHIAGLWAEYEAETTATARFAHAIDRLQPLLLNSGSGGISWQENGVRHSQTAAVNAKIGDASAELWSLAASILDAAADATILIDDRP